MATDEILRLDDVVAGYGKMTILQRHSPSACARGAITTVIGPNGAGKSTVFKTVFGMLPVRAGRIFFDGRDITNSTPRRADRGRHLLRAAGPQHLSRALACCTISSSAA